MAKLEQTQANLLRVGDIVAELKKQVGSLERQAKRRKNIFNCESLSAEVNCFWRY